MYETISYEKAQKMIENLYNNLRILNKKFKINFKLLKDPSSDEDIKDLVALFGSATEADFNSSNPSLIIQATCRHIETLLKALSTEYQLDIQNKLLTHFQTLLKH